LLCFCFANGGEFDGGIEISAVALVRYRGSFFSSLQPLSKLALLIMMQDDEVTCADPQAIFYNDISAEEAAPYIESLKPQSYPTFSSQMTVEPWRVIPSTYILCEKDAAIPLPVQEGMVGMAQNIAPGSFDVVERCNASHSPFISKPEWLAEKLIQAAS
jgi:hypothetical protein